MSSLLHGTRVLVVEDEIIVAMEVQCLLQDAGCEVVELVHTLDDAERVTSVAHVDVTLLDINLHGQMTFDLARQLSDGGKTVILATGYDDLSIPSELRALPRVSKPFTGEQLRRTLLAATGDGDAFG